MEQVNNNNIEEKLSTLNSQLSTNIYPIFDRMMTREDKERLLKQRSVMVWFTGLSGSGKSTVAIALERELHKCGCCAASWTATISAAGSTTISAFRLKTG